MSNVHTNLTSIIKINLTAIKNFVTFLRTQVGHFGMFHFWQRYCLILKKTYLPIPPTKQLAISTKIADRPNKRSLLSCRRWFNLSPGSFQTKSSLSGSIKDLFLLYLRNWDKRKRKQEVWKTHTHTQNPQIYLFVEMTSQINSYDNVQRDNIAIQMSSSRGQFQK